MVYGREARQGKEAGRGDDFVEIEVDEDQAQELFTTGIAKGGGGQIPYRDELEQTFGEPLGDLRWFSGQEEALDAMGADGASRGSDILVGGGTPSKGLVGHEVAHALQNRRAGRVGPVQAHGRGGASSAAEAEADRAGEAAEAGRSFRVTGLPGRGVQLRRKLRVPWKAYRYDAQGMGEPTTPAPAHILANQIGQPNVSGVADQVTDPTTVQGDAMIPVSIVCNKAFEQLLSSGGPSMPADGFAYVANVPTTLWLKESYEKNRPPHEVAQLYLKEAFGERGPEGRFCLVVGLNTKLPATQEEMAHRIIEMEYVAGLIKGFEAFPVAVINCFWSSAASAVRADKDVKGKASNAGVPHGMIRAFIRDYGNITTAAVAAMAKRRKTVYLQTGDADAVSFRDSPPQAMEGGRPMFERYDQKLSDFGKRTGQTPLVATGGYLFRPGEGRGETNDLQAQVGYNNMFQREVGAQTSAYFPYYPEANLTLKAAEDGALVDATMHTPWGIGGEESLAYINNLKKTVGREQLEKSMLFDVDLTMVTDADNQTAKFVPRESGEIDDQTIRSFYKDMAQSTTNPQQFYRRLHSSFGFDTRREGSVVPQLTDMFFLHLLTNSEVAPTRELVKPEHDHPTNRAASALTVDALGRARGLVEAVNQRSDGPRYLDAMAMKGRRLARKLVRDSRKRLDQEPTSSDDEATELPFTDRLAKKQESARKPRRATIKKIDKLVEAVAQFLTKGIAEERNVEEANDACADALIAIDGLDRDDFINGDVGVITSHIDHFRIVGERLPQLTECALDGSQLAGLIKQVGEMLSKLEELAQAAAKEERNFFDQLTWGIYGGQLERYAELNKDDPIPPPILHQLMCYAVHFAVSVYEKAPEQSGRLDDYGRKIVGSFEITQQTSLANETVLGGYISGTPMHEVDKQRPAQVSALRDTQRIAALFEQLGSQIDALGSQLGTSGAVFASGARSLLRSFSAMLALTGRDQLPTLLDQLCREVSKRFGQSMSDVTGTAERKTYETLAKTVKELLPESDSPQPELPMMGPQLPIVPPPPPDAATFVEEVRGVARDVRNLWGRKVQLDDKFGNPSLSFSPPPVAPLTSEEILGLHARFVAARQKVSRAAQSEVKAWLLRELEGLENMLFEVLGQAPPELTRDILIHIPIGPWKGAYREIPISNEDNLCLYRCICVGAKFSLEAPDLRAAVVRRYRAIIQEQGAAALQSVVYPELRAAWDSTLLVRQEHQIPWDAHPDVAFPGVKGQVLTTFQKIAESGNDKDLETYLNSVQAVSDYVEALTLGQFASMSEAHVAGIISNTAIIVHHFSADRQYLASDDPIGQSSGSPIHIINRSGDHFNLLQKL